MTFHQSSPSPQWEQGAAHQQGGRHEQQDRWGIFQPPGQRGLLALVADGMGGHVGGALGAQIVVDVAQHFVQTASTLLGTQPSVALDQLCQAMHDAINHQSDTARSTVVIVWIEGIHVHWLNLGDSRLYHLRDGQRLMRTRDHSAVQLLIDLGEIKEAEMGSHPAQNRLYRSLGGPEVPKPDTGQFTVQVGDVLALCSDGIWEYIDEQALWASTVQTDLTSAARSLTQQAVQQGGPTADNATLLLLRAGAVDRRLGTDSGVQTTDPPHWLDRWSARFTALFDRDPR